MKYTARAILKNGRDATVTVDAKDKEEAKFLLHHYGHAIRAGGIEYKVERYDYRTVKLIKELSSYPKARPF